MRFNVEGYSAPIGTSSCITLKPAAAIKIAAEEVAPKAKICIPLAAARITLLAMSWKVWLPLQKAEAGISGKLKLHTKDLLRMDNAEISMQASAFAIKTKQKISLRAGEIKTFANSVKAYKKLHLRAEKAKMPDYRAGKASAAVYAYAYLALPELVLAPGRTLAIDSENITVTLDGENAISYWQTGSSPILLGGGANTLIYEDTSAGRELACNIVWRDRWI